jgi:D-alanine transaminase
MSELIWLNGQTLPMSEARISVEDRGFQFADGVYEVVRLYNGRPFALSEHMDRLERSAAGIELTPPLSRSALTAEIQKFIAGISAGEGMIYLQLTRGVCPRNHLYPTLLGKTAVQPTLLFYFRPLPAIIEVERTPGIKLLTVPDERWQRCWIKSIALLPNVLAKNRAVAAGYDEAVFIDGGIVTECAACNLFAITGRTLITHPVGNKVLPGVTRQAILSVASDAKVSVQERPATEAEFLAADELFIASTTREISWVSHWNAGLVRAKTCGPITQSLHAALRRHVAHQTGKNS